MSQNCSNPNIKILEPDTLQPCNPKLSEIRTGGLFMYVQSRENCPQPRIVLQRDRYRGIGHVQLKHLPLSCGHVQIKWEWWDRAESMEVIKLELISVEVRKVLQ